MWLTYILLGCALLYPLPYQLSLFIILSSAIALNAIYMLTPRFKPLTLTSHLKSRLTYQLVIEFPFECLKVSRYQYVKNGIFSFLQPYYVPC